MSAQWGPYNPGCQSLVFPLVRPANVLYADYYDNSSTEMVEIFPNEFEVEANVCSSTVLFFVYSWKLMSGADVGGVFQQVTSCLAKTNPLSYNSTTNFQKYGFEYTRSHFPFAVSKLSTDVSRL